MFSFSSCSRRKRVANGQQAVFLIVNRPILVTEQRYVIRSNGTMNMLSIYIESRAVARIYFSFPSAAARTGTRLSADLRWENTVAKAGPRATTAHCTTTPFFSTDMSSAPRLTAHGQNVLSLRPSHDITAVSDHNHSRRSGVHVETHRKLPTHPRRGRRPLRQKAKTSRALSV